jgi:ABC-type nitrate/sulfonate/bicarbonate transport system permease component
VAPGITADPACSRKLFPPLEEVAATFVRLTASGILPHHVFDTLLRLAAGFALAAVVGVAIGILMGRSRRAEDIFLPLISIGAPIPGIAYAPLFLLWFGLGNKSTVLGRLRPAFDHLSTT